LIWIGLDERMIFIGLQLDSSNWIWMSIQSQVYLHCCCTCTSSYEPSYI